MSTPEENLIQAFWKCLRDDLVGRGCTLDSLPPAQRRLPYAERVIIERDQLKAAAQIFLGSPHFDFWAGLSQLNTDKLRGRFDAIRDN